MKPFLITILLALSVSSFAQKNWESLFNNDLSNAMDKQGVWHYDGDVLTASKDACIFTEIEYENFVIDLEFKNEKGTNSGVIVYCTNRKDWIPNSVEIQISDDNYFKENSFNFPCKLILYNIIFP